MTSMVAIRKLSARLRWREQQPDLMMEKRKRFQPGENAPTSGVYAAFHLAHAAAHHITVLYGEAFPRCRSCGDGVKKPTFCLGRIPSRNSIPHRHT